MKQEPMLHESPERDRRKTILMTLSAILLVAVGYVVLLLLGGRALDRLPLAKQIGAIGEGIRDITEFDPGSSRPIPALANPEAGGVLASPSPVVARPSPSASPSFIPPAPGDPSEVTFTIEFENTTGVRLTGVRLVDRIPSGTVFRSGSAVPGASFDGAQLVWDIGTLEPNQVGKVSFSVLTNRTGRISNRAVMTSNEAPSSEIESSATVD